MTEFKGTKGEWGYTTNSNVIVKETGEVVFKGEYKENGVSVANAILGASAPELLEASIEVIKWVDENISKTEFTDLRQAINKALNK